MGCETQMLRVLRASKGPITLPQIQQRIYARYGVMHGEAAISARIRGANRRMKADSRCCEMIYRQDYYQKASKYWIGKC